MLLYSPSSLTMCTAQLSSARVGLAREVRIGPQAGGVKTRIQQGKEKIGSISIDPYACSGRSGMESVAVTVRGQRGEAEWVETGRKKKASPGRSIRV